MASEVMSASSSTIPSEGSSVRTLPEMIDYLDQFLHGDRIGLLKDVFQKIENDIQIRRVNVVLGFLACLALFFLFSDGAHFVCDFIGFVYPACVLIWTIEQGSEQINYRKWLTYWVIFNTFHFMEYFLLNVESSQFRIYWLLKCTVIIMCCTHLPENIYVLVIKPFLENFQAPIDDLFTSAAQSIDHSWVIFFTVFYAFVWGYKSLCNGLCFLYPAYMSMVSLLQGAEVDKMYWLTFWVFYSSYNILDHILGGFLLYYFVKFTLLELCLLQPKILKEVYILGQKLIQKHKPMNRAYRAVKHFVQVYLTTHPDPNVGRADRIEGGSSGTSSLWNLAVRQKNAAVKVKGQQSVVDPSEVELLMLSPLVQAVMELNVDAELVKKAVTWKLAQDGPGQNFTSVEALMEAIFDLSSCKEDDEDGSSVDEYSYQMGMKDLLHIPRSLSSDNYSQAVPTKVFEENRQLKEQRLCKICMVEEVGIVFSPCGHLVCCHGCSFQLKICPICRAEIKSSLRAYMS